MYCIPPVNITPAKVESSTPAEPDTTNGEVAWSSGEVIAKDVIRIRTTTHRKYRAVIAMASGENVTAPENAPDKWKDIGFTNKYAFTEINRSNATKYTTQIVAVIVPGERVDSFLLGGIVGATAKVEQLSAVNAVLKTWDYPLSSRLGTASWSDYFFNPFENIPSVMQFDVPQIAQSKFRVTITAASPGQPVALSTFVVGKSVYMGEVQWQPESDEQNFSKMERTFDGDLPESNLIPRTNVPQLALKIHAPKAITNELRALRKAMNAKIAVWTGLDQNITDPYYETMLVVGLYRQFKINLKYFDYTEVTMMLEER